MDCPATVPGYGDLGESARPHGRGHDQHRPTAPQDGRVSDWQRMDFRRTLPLVLTKDDDVGISSWSVMPSTTSPSASNQHTSARCRAAASLKIAAASRASRASFEEMSAAVSATRPGLYCGGTSTGGITCSPTTRPPVRAARSNAYLTRRRPAGRPSTCTTNLETCQASELLFHAAWMEGGHGLCSSITMRSGRQSRDCASTTA